MQLYYGFYRTFAAFLIITFRFKPGNFHQNKKKNYFF